MEIKIIADKLSITLPATPNFFRTKDGGCIDVRDISEESLKVIGEAWTKDLIRKSKITKP